MTVSQMQWKQPNKIFNSHSLGEGLSQKSFRKILRSKYEYKKWKVTKKIKPKET